MGRSVAFAYGLVCYVAFLVVFLYAIGFVSGFAVPKTIDSGSPAPLAGALVINLLLMGLFAGQHSVMARPGFKRWWTRIVPEPIERSTYVLIASALLALLFWQWRPMTAVVWRAEGAAAVALYALAALGWVIVLASTFIINHFDLFGLRQVYLHLTRRPYRHVPFKAPVLLYKLVRHPLMLGFVIAFWAAPTMTLGHLYFAAVTTAYILIALHLEERDLVTFFGDTYRRYQSSVPMIVPFLKPARREAQGDNQAAVARSRKRV